MDLSIACDLSILIPTLPNRKAMLDRLLGILTPQIEEAEKSGARVEVLIESDNQERTTGEKRNRLLDRSKGRYVVFIDDDDWVEPEYLSLILEALKSNPDCVSFGGWYRKNGGQEIPFEHGLEHPFPENRGTVHLRPPWHINPHRRELALKTRFEAITFGEDRDYALRLYPLLKKEAKISKPLYHYDFVSYQKREGERRRDW